MRTRHFVSILPLVLLVLATAVGYGQTGTVIVQASKLGGSDPITGTVTFQPRLKDGTPASARLSSGGQTNKKAITGPVAGGSFALSGIIDTVASHPANICYDVTVATRAGQALGPGYSCVQPAYNNDWCTAGVCRFDDYLPDVTPLAVSVQGPKGDKGDTGCVVGSTCNSVLNLTPLADQYVEQPTGTMATVSSLNGVLNASTPRYSTGSVSGGLQEAYNDNPSTGGTVELSKDLYLTGAVVTTTKGKDLHLRGNGHTIFCVTVSGINCLTTKSVPGAVAGTGNGDITIDDVNFDGYGASTTSIGLFMDGSASAIVMPQMRNVKFTGFPGQAMKTYNTENAHFDGLKFQRTCGGLWMESASNAVQLDSMSVQFGRNDCPNSYPVYLGKGSYAISFSNLVAQNNPQLTTVMVDADTLLDKTGAVATNEAISFHNGDLEQNGDGTAASAIFRFKTSVGFVQEIGFDHTSLYAYLNGKLFVQTGTHLAGITIVGGNIRGNAGTFSDGSLPISGTSDTTSTARIGNPIVIGMNVNDHISDSGPYYACKLGLAAIANGETCVNHSIVNNSTVSQDLGSTYMPNLGLNQFISRHLGISNATAQCLVEVFNSHNGSDAFLTYGLCGGAAVTFGTDHLSFNMPTFFSDLTGTGCATPVLDATGRLKRGASVTCP